jgi:hypothetical protein
MKKTVPARVVLLLVVCIATLCICRVSAGDGTHTTQYDLLGLTDVLASKLEAAGNATSRAKVGDNVFRLVTGDEYVVDPKAKHNPVLEIKIEDTNYLATQSFYDADVGLKLCSAIPDKEVTYTSLTMGGTAPVVGTKAMTGAAHKIYTIRVTQTNVRDDIFPIIDGVSSTRAAYKKMSICGKVKHAAHYTAADLARTRPIPLFTILFKNAAVLRRVHDSRNSKVCEKQKHRYINVDTFSDLSELMTGPRGHAGPTTTKTTTGMLKVFTPNQRVYNVDDVSACRAQYYQIAFRCSDSVWSISKTWLPVLEHGVSAKECLRWKMEKTCVVFDSSALSGVNHTETLDMAQVSAHQYRTNVTDNTVYGIFGDKIQSRVHRMCLNRASGKMFVRNCILDTDVQTSYSFPFEATRGGGRLSTPFGNVKATVMATTIEASTEKDELTGEPEYGMTDDKMYGWVHLSHADHPAATLIWPKATNQLRHHALDGTNNVCPFTPLIEIPVTAMITDNLEHTDMALNRAVALKQVITFVENSADSSSTPHRFKVYDNQKMDFDDMTHLGLNPASGKCMRNPSGVYQTYMIDGTVLLQFIDKSQMAKPARYVSQWNRNKLKYSVRDPLVYSTEDVKRKNVKHAGINREISGLPTDLEEAVCSTTVTKYTDAYKHEWECKHGVATLTKVSTQFNAVDRSPNAANPAAPVLATMGNIFSGWFTALDVPTDEAAKTMIENVGLNLAKLHNYVQNEKIGKYSLFNKLGALEPSLIGDMLFPDEDVKLTRSGDMWAVHRCKKVLWSDMRVVPSLRLDFFDMPIPQIYRNMGSNLDHRVPHLSDLCYATPIVKTLTKELGVAYMQVIDSGSELSTELNLITPCNRMDGRLHFNVGDQVVTFSGKSGEFHHAVERRTSPMSSAYNIFHKGKSDPLVKNIQSGGTHITNMMGGGTKMNNNYLATDEKYTPKPDESSQFTGYHSNVDGSIRDHLLEVSFVQSMTPVSPSKFLAAVDASSVNKLNLERYKRQERDNVPHHFWPYTSHSLSSRIPNTPELAMDDKSKSHLYNRYRLVNPVTPDKKPETVKPKTRKRRSAMDAANYDAFGSNVFVGGGGGGSGYTVNDQRKLPLQLRHSDSYSDFTTDSMHLHASAFMEEYGFTVLVVTCVLTFILTPTVLYLATKQAAMDKYTRQQARGEHGNTMLDHNLSYASNAAIGSLGMRKSTYYDYKSHEQKDRGTKILYMSEDTEN